MEKSNKQSVNRRGFLKGAAVGAASLIAQGTPAEAQQAAAVRPAGAALPSAAALAAENDPVSSDVLVSGQHPGSDHMVDVIKSLGFEYAIATAGSSFRALHESLVNYGGNKAPEFIHCLHEEISVAMADGYAQVEGKPALVVTHGTVGIQHSSMAIYNAFCGRLPVYIIAGNTLDATERRPGAEWVHSVQDAAGMVRDYIKWDDTPISLKHFAESAIRAYKIAMTPPMAPVMIVADSTLQETPFPENEVVKIPKLTVPSPPQGDSGAVAEVARLLVAAENPMIIVGGVRTQTGMDQIVALADLLQCRVNGGRFMPSHHPLNQGGGVANADIIVGLDESDLWGRVHTMRDQLRRSERLNMKAGAKLISISSSDLYTKSNYQDFNRFSEVDMALAADAEATLPSLIEACKKLITADRKRVFEERGKMLAAAKTRAMDQARREATYAWNASPISSDRLNAEMWAAVKSKDWAAGPRGVVGPLWNVTKLYQTMTAAGGVGLGHNMPASIGGALAHRKHGRFMVNVQNDGCMMFTSGSLWTAAHHRIPLLTVIYNNRGYHTELMHIQRMANRNQRGVTSDHTFVGTKIENPNIDFAMLARSMGVYGDGPITNPNDLQPALQKAIAVVERGEPAVVDVVMQPR
jgi:acetolactate synthase I/II/III large subunit